MLSHLQEEAATFTPTRDFALVDRAVNETDERGRVYTVYGVLVQFRGQKIGALHRFSFGGAFLLLLYLMSAMFSL